MGGKVTAYRVFGIREGISASYSRIKLLVQVLERQGWHAARYFCMGIACGVSAPHPRASRAFTFSYCSDQHTLIAEVT